VPGIRKVNSGPKAGPGNRRALISAAREVFSSAGYHAPLSAVARRAGVGQGSLYRHFPDRLTLGVAVFDVNITALESYVARTDCSIDDLLDRIIEKALVSTAVIDMISASPDDPRVVHLGERIRSVVGEVVSRERAGGRLRATLATDDVMLAVSMLAVMLARTPGAERPAMASRARALFHTAFAPE
jgi:AcrR family transcriptional regulator